MSALSFVLSVLPDQRVSRELLLWNARTPMVRLNFHSRETPSAKFVHLAIIVQHEQVLRLCVLLEHILRKAQPVALPAVRVTFALIQQALLLPAQLDFILLQQDNRNVQNVHLAINAKLELPSQLLVEQDLTA